MLLISKFLAYSSSVHPLRYRDMVATDLLACPRDQSRIMLVGNSLRCEQGHQYAIVDNIPVMLIPDVQHTHQAAEDSLEQAAGTSLPAFVSGSTTTIDPYVNSAIVGTNGIMYRAIAGKLSEYPIPALHAPPGNGRLFLDVGCNWGRWCVAAARLGYRPVGIDPSLEALRAATRVSRQLGVEADFVVADGRYLPFGAAMFDTVFSYSVLQHFPESDVVMTLREIRRVLKVGGNAIVQMANRFGLRSLYHQARRGFRTAKGFEVRYWTPARLRQAFSESIGPVDMSIDGFFSLNAQSTDLRLLPRRYRAVVRASSFLKDVSNTLPILGTVADSLYLTARVPNETGQ